MPNGGTVAVATCSAGTVLLGIKEAVMLRNGSIKILNVNDHSPTRFVWNLTLTNAGYQVQDAETGRAALQSIEHYGPHLVLLDVRLPDIDGFTLCQRIKSLHSFLPVLMVSAWFTNSKDHVTALNAGADGYLDDPSDSETILAKIQTLLNIYTHWQAAQISRTALEQQIDQLLARLGRAESANVELQKEIERLQCELQRLKDQQ
jgi:DNA-binding response OmpR family regulator